MEISKKQKQASRENGKLGGVKTDEGKAISSQNAFRHGILGNCKTSYDQLDIDALYADLAKEFGEETSSRRIMLRLLVLTVVRLARCARAETELLRESLNPRITEIKHALQFVDFLDKEVVVSQGEPAILNTIALERFALIYERYEPKLLSRFLRLTAELRQSH